MSDSQNKNISAENAGTKQKKEKKRKGAKKRISAGKIFLIIFLIIIALVLSVIFIPSLRAKVFSAVVSNKISELSGGYKLYTVQRRDIATTLTGTGTLQPYDSYNITATVTGDILSADFEEMDEVLEDQVLYVVDSSDVVDDIAEKRKDVQDALDDYNDILEDYKDLTVISDFSGTVRELYVEEGDNVSAGTKIAYIVDNDTMVLEVPFFASNTDALVNGSPAAVTFRDTDEVVDGTVTEISNLTSVNSTGALTRNIKISVKNPGGIYFGMTAYANAKGTDGNTYYCSGEGTFSYNEEDTVISDASGEIESISIKEGQNISKGNIVLKISSENLDKQAKSLKKAYDNQIKALEDLEERLEDYTVKAPISGTVVQKNYKYLDTIGSSSMSSTTNLAIIYDMSKLTFELGIDELDLGMIEVGQKVNITSDSIDNMTFEGTVTKKSIVGSSSGGTTVYPVTVEIPGNEYLLPGMNINAEIVVSNHENVLAVPVDAVKRGNHVEVVKQNSTESPQNIQGTETADNKAPSGPVSHNGKAQTVTEKPETELVEVEIGASNDEYVEIISGLNEGDVVVSEIINVSKDAFSSMIGMASMGGNMGGMGMSGGQRPSGMGGMGSGMSGMSGSQRPTGMGR
ncbi:MAG: HlyD family efflux transporter periplasmic adaptor subunit [Clostridia bacterium]|nr:HlyD family efflux transporter periplasmic adaptor subunit [Clostridia bacterium]